MQHLFGINFSEIWHEIARLSFKNVCRIFPMNLLLQVYKSDIQTRLDLAGPNVKQPLADELSWVNMF